MLFTYYLIPHFSFEHELGIKMEHENLLLKTLRTVLHGHIGENGLASNDRVFYMYVHVFDFVLISILML